MKKNLLLLSLAFAAVAANAQVTETVSVGVNYANQKWYSMENDEQGTTQTKDNWDLAFETSGYTSAILANTQKTNFALYKAPYNISQYGTIDTLGMHTSSAWKIVYNSDTTWAVGAFNKGANPNNTMDLGWGIYDMNTHFVNGDSCYVVKLSASVYKKLKIVSLANGVYTFEYANINGTSSQTATITKSTYTTKNFVYFDMTTNAVVDREPATSSWDLTFVRYHAILPPSTPYPVVGVMTNKGVKVAQANNVVGDINTYSDWFNQSYQTNITTIGHDWKNFDLNSNSWKIVSDTCYFVKDKGGNAWKITWVSFGGSTTGDFVFNKTKLSSTGINEANGNEIASMSLYPNPSNGSDVNLLLSTEVLNATPVASVYDINGKLVAREALNNTLNNNLNVFKLNTGDLNNGVYIVNVSVGAYSANQRLVITK